MKAKGQSTSSWQNSMQCFFFVTGSVRRHWDRWRCACWVYSLSVSWIMSLHLGAAYWKARNHSLLRFREIVLASRWRNEVLRGAKEVYQGCKLSERSISLVVLHFFLLQERREFFNHSVRFFPLSCFSLLRIGALTAIWKRPRERSSIQLHWRLRVLRSWSG